ncbi:hypothetical protein PIROE2DRAFT_8352 [Piromyces sp. E2]|nr:hypothetical protein PIROE2DRAFT_8352 [Piromyces sp. E2]|eukprot:OUM64809.1 hypothetical protein PIROE2DRAFT_8352 [Piromyces sp. E2]
MHSIKFNLITLSLLCIQMINGIPINKRDVNPVNKAFENICKVLEYFPNGDKVCQFGELFTKDKYLHIVPPGQCKRIGVEQYGVTEICSSPPFQLYFEADNWDVNGCYKIGEAHKTYMQCCQFRHAWNFMTANAPNASNAIAQAHIGTFCSGPSGGANFKSPSQHGVSFNLNSKKDTLLYYQTNLAYEACNDNSSLDCEHAKQDLNLAFDKDHEINWHTVKKV